MSDALENVSRDLLEPAGLENRHLETVLGQIMGRAVDYADLYFQHSAHESWTLEEGRVKSASHNIEQGVGVRAVSGEKQGFAYAEDLRLPALTAAAQAARAISLQGQEARVPVARATPVQPLYPAVNPLASLGDDAKVELLQRVEAEARRQDPRIQEVIVNLSGVQEKILVLGSDGRLVADVRPLVRMDVTTIAEHNGRREQGHGGGGSRSGYEYFLGDEEHALSYAREAVRQALINLEAVDSPAGTMDVVLGPGWPGILLHEAVGHGLEGDFNRKGTSAFAGRVGERVASPGVTVVDDGTIEGRRGSLSVDDEGTPTQRTVLIEDGILKGYLQDSMNARLTGVAPTGNGRRESYAHLPMPRMTNTFMLSGEHAPGDVIASVKRGLYAVQFGGGQVDITSGKFVFSASEAYLIEDGKVTRPVKGATLIGNGPDVLTRVSMIGNDLKLDTGVGTCGKDGQSVPVGVGLPTLRIDGLTVGGTQV